MIAEEIVEQVRALHRTWGETDVDELDPLDLWETLGRILDGAGS